MHRMPSLHALRAFEAAARLGSFTRAGAELHLTPSAISHQVRALEDFFGRPMFIRASRQVILTPEGERLLAALSQAFGVIRAACAELSPSAKKGDLGVHCTPSFAAKWLSPRLPRFMAQESDINIRMTTSAETPDLMKQEALDVIIAYGTAPREPGITVLSLGEEDIVALCAPNYEYAAGPSCVDDYDRVAWLESTFSPVRWSDWFSLNGVSEVHRRAGMAFDRGSLVVAAAAQGLGVALETLCFAQAELDSGSLVPFGGDRFQRIRREMHFLCYRTRDRDNRNIRRFCDWVIDQAAS